MPAKRLSPAINEKHLLSVRLKAAVEDSGLSLFAISKRAGLNHSILERFVKGQRDLKLASADKLAAALGLRLVEPVRQARRPRSAGAGERSSPSSDNQ